MWWRKVVVAWGLGKEERAAQQQGGSDTRAVLHEWEMEKRAQCCGGMEQWGCPDGANFYRAFL